MSRTLGLLAGSAALLGGWTSTRAESERVFFDGFENASQLLDLLAPDGSRWTHFQRTRPDNRVEVVGSPSREGSAALRLVAAPSREDVSKADVERELEARAGDLVTIAAWFLAPSGPSLDNVFLLDLECRSCWPDGSLLPNKSPGVRIQLKGAEGFPVVERGKIGRDHHRNASGTSALPFPRDRWTFVQWRLKLAMDDGGRTEILFDGQPAFAASGPNMPDPNIFRRWGVQLQRTAYDRFQIGITANGSRNPVELFVDAVSVDIERADR